MLIATLFPILALIFTTVLFVMVVGILFWLTKYLKLKTEVLKQEFEKNKLTGN